MELVINIPNICHKQTLAKSNRSHFNVLRVFQTLWLSMESFYIVFILPIVYWLQDMIWAMLGGRGQTSGSDKALIYLSLVSHFTTSHDISPLPLSESLWSLIRSEQRENVKTAQKVSVGFICVQLRNALRICESSNFASLHRTRIGKGKNTPRRKICERWPTLCNSVTENCRSNKTSPNLCWMGSKYPERYWEKICDNLKE